METEKHKWLKKLALQFLKEKGMNVVCKEVPVGRLSADTLGLNMKRKEIRIIECKQDRADFKKSIFKLNSNTGYSQYCHYLYIICPHGLIMANEVDPSIGLIYANDNDELEVIKKPVKNVHRLKSYFETILRNTVHRLSNEVFYKDEKEYKDPLQEKFSRAAEIFFTAVRCPQCKHVTKDLININTTKAVTCKNCKSKINIANAKVRQIIGFNKKFIEKINELNYE